MPRIARMLDSPSEILLKIFEPKIVAVNEAAVERLLCQKLQLAHAQHRNRALPTDPDEILPLRLYVPEGVTEKPACQCPIEFSSHRDHGEGLAHSRPYEL